MLEKILYRRQKMILETLLIHFYVMIYNDILKYFNM